MGKVRTRFLGVEEVEQKQKEKQRKKAQEKKKVKAPGKHRGGERMVVVEAGQEALEKMKRAEEAIKEEPIKKEKKAVKKIKERKRGKNYKLAKAKLDKGKTYSLEEAVKLLKAIAFASFDESLELHINVSKEGLKGEIELPHKTGKTVRVRIADDNTLSAIEKGKIDFDVLVSHPSYMPRLAKLAKFLGPKGLMPNPKAGTVSEKPEEVLKRYQAGVLKWKTETKSPLIHQMLGKVSYSEKDLVDNIKAFVSSVGKSNIRSAFLKTTMSPSLRLDLDKI